MVLSIQGAKKTNPFSVTKTTLADFQNSINPTTPSYSIQSPFRPAPSISEQLDALGTLGDHNIEEFRRLNNTAVPNPFLAANGVTPESLAESSKIFADAIAANDILRERGKGPQSQAMGVNQLRGLGINASVDNPNTDLEQPVLDELKNQTKAIQDLGINQVVANQSPAQNLIFDNPQLIPNNNTLNTPWLDDGGTGNNIPLFQDALFTNPEGGPNTAEETAAAAENLAPILEEDPNFFNKEGEATQLINNLYAQYGLNPDDEGVAHWLNNLIGGATPEEIQANFALAASQNPLSNNYVAPTPTGTTTNTTPPPETTTNTTPPPPATTTNTTPPPSIDPLLQGQLNASPLASLGPTGQEGWWNQFEDADAFKSFLQGDQQQQSNTSMQDFMQFMMMMNMMGGFGGRGGYGGSQYGYGGLNPGGVQAAYNPLEQLQGSWDWFNNAFGRGGRGVQGGTTANVQ